MMVIRSVVPYQREESFPVGFVPPKKGAPVLAYAPHCPVPREERWYVVLADAANNVTLSWNSVTLSEAECMGVADATTSGRPGRLLQSRQLYNSRGRCWKA